MKTFKFTLKVWSSIAFILLALSFTAVPAEARNDGGKAKYIFLFIGDGMGASHVAAAESYLSYKAGKLGGEQLTFTQFPVLGMATTYSADRNITCSSAAGTAISCGVKTKNGYLGVDSEGNKLESIAYKLKKEGYNIGIMSSVPINHATPAAFYANSLDRDSYYDISQQIPQSGFDFFAGDGFLDYYGKSGNEEPISEFLEENGATLCFSEEEYNEEKDGAKQMILCQPSSKEHDAEAYTTDAAQGSDFSLSEMLTTCMDFIGDSKPFFIMCEGGDIDWAAHDNKTMPMIDNIMNFNGAIDVAYEFYRKHPDQTLIVVTADHETGGVALGGPAGKSKRGDMIFWDVYEESAASGEEPDAKENTDLNLKANIGWTTTGHTGAPVPVYSIGKGAERFAGRMDNTEISRKIMDME